MKNPILRGIALFLFVTFIVFALVLAAPSQNEGKTTPSNPKKSFDANTNPSLEFDYQKSSTLIILTGNMK
jgi:hypothetical protein